MKNDPRSCDRNFYNCAQKPEKNSGLQRGLNPWPREYRLYCIKTYLEFISISVLISYSRHTANSARISFLWSTRAVCQSLSPFFFRPTSFSSPSSVCWPPSTTCLHFFSQFRICRVHVPAEQPRVQDFSSARVVFWRTVCWLLLFRT